MYLLQSGPIPLLLPAPKTVKALPARASRKVRVFSFGGGVQSHAVLVLQALGKLAEPYDLFIFANVGHDSENPETLNYLERYTRPFCKEHGINFVEVQKQRGRDKDETPDTLLAQIYRQQKSIVIPARMGHNGAPGNRNCTDDYKISVVDQAIKTMGFTHAIVGLGISTDEFGRVRSQNWYTDNGLQKRREYPLIDAMVSRNKALAIIAAAGLPQPPKSSCWFCPFHKRGEWIEMRRDNPVLFGKAVEVERELNRKRTALKKDDLYLHPDCVPLDRAVGEQPLLFPVEMMDACDTGYCWT